MIVLGLVVVMVGRMPPCCLPPRFLLNSNKKWIKNTNSIHTH